MQKKKKDHESDPSLFSNYGFVIRYGELAGWSVAEPQTGAENVL